MPIPGVENSHNEYIESKSESMQSEIDTAINHAKSDLNDLKADVLEGNKKVNFKTPDSINHFYRLEGDKIIFQLDEVKKYLEAVYNRLSGMKNQKFSEVSQENNFTGTILAIQIALKAFETDPLKPMKYDIGKINGEYNEITQDAIKQFQTDFGLKWKDGKPGRETIGKILTVLGDLIDNKKTYKEYLRKEEEILKNDVMSIINESVRANISLSSLTSDYKKTITNYIIEGNLCTDKNKIIEEQIKSMADNPLNWKIKYLVDHHNEPLKDNIRKIKEKDENLGKRNRNNYTIDFDKIGKQETIRGGSDKYTFGHNLTEIQKSIITNVLSGWGSPVTAEMVADSCKKSGNVPVEYLLAFMQNDSRVGTKGRGVRTHNPGNVGNTERRSKDWGTWGKGVDACANNLQERINAYLDAKNEHNGKGFNNFPTPEELATGKSKGGFKFFGIYMSAPSGPSSVAGMVKKWVNRLKGE